MGGAAFVGGQVEAGAASFVVGEDRVEVRDEGVLNGGGVVGAMGPEQDAFAARNGDGGAGAAAGGSGRRGGAVGEGDEAASLGVTSGKGGAGGAG